MSKKRRGNRPPDLNSEVLGWENPNWIATATGYEFCPNDERQAIAHLTICYKYKKAITLKGFADRYNWSRDKARRFLRQVGVEIFYPKGRMGGRFTYGYLAILPKNKQNSKTAHLRMIINKGD